MSPSTEVYKVVSLTAIRSGALKALFDLQLPSGMILVDCSYFVTDDDYFVKPPQRWSERYGKKTYVDLVRFSTPEQTKEFQVLALDAIMRYAKGER